MKKVVLALSLLFVGSVLKAEELRPQFRAWKSSWIGTGTYGNTLMSTSPILFHMVTGSATLNAVGDNFFIVQRSTGSNGAVNSFAQNSSTKVFCPLNASGQGERDKIDYPFDTFSDSFTFWRKTGGAAVGYEWDFYKVDPWNPNNRD